MQACVNWVLIMFGTQVIQKTRPVRCVFLDYCSISYDYEFMNVNIRASRFENSTYFAKFDLDGERLPQLYLELVDAYKKRCIPQNGHVVVLKYSPIGKKNEKKFQNIIRA